MIWLCLIYLLSEIVMGDKNRVEFGRWGKEWKESNERLSIVEGENSSVPLFSRNEIFDPSSMSSSQSFPFRHYSRSKLRPLPRLLDQIIWTFVLERVRDIFSFGASEQGGDGS